MKKWIKRCLILAGLLLAVGVGLHTAGAVMGGRYESDSYFAQRWDDFSDRWGGVSGHWRKHIGGLLGVPQTKDSGAITDAITAIDAEVDCGDIFLRRGEEFSVSMAWNLRGFTMDYEIEDGVLKVDSDSRSGFLNGVTGMENSVVITVPELAALDKVELSTNLGDISVDASCIIDEADLATALGDISCTEDAMILGLDAETALGDVDITLPWSREAYRWHIETDLGDLKIDHIPQDKRLRDDIVGGSCRGGEGANWVNAHSSLGDVSIVFGEPA